MQISLNAWMASAGSVLARLMRGAHDPDASESAGGGLRAQNRVWSTADNDGSDSSRTLHNSQAPEWGSAPDGASEFVLDVQSRRATVEGLEALGLGEPARALANPFRLVINRNGLYFYSFGDREVLDLSIGWPSVTGLAATVVRPEGFFEASEALNALELTAVDAQGREVRFPLIARDPGSGFGVATDLSSPAEQQRFIEQIDRFYKDRPTIVDSGSP